jgi:hypothetical protein
MSDIPTASTKMFNASHARNLAETLWGRPCIGARTTRLKTSRKGAFWFSCSNGEGFIIDGRCLTAQERNAIDKYKKPDIAIEFYDHSGALRKRTNPFHNAPIYKAAHRPDSDWCQVETPVYRFASRLGKSPNARSVFEDCLPVLFARILTANHSVDQAFRQFEAAYTSTAHEVIEVRMQVMERHEAFGLAKTKNR